MGDLTLNVAVSESPVKAGLDAYYDFMKQLFPPGPADRIAIFGTAMEFDITKLSRLYNDYVVRAFADRSVRVSPVPGQAAGDMADRYSGRFTDMLVALVSEIDAQLTPAQEAQIQRHEAAINAISDDRDKYLNDVEDAWAVQMERLGIDPTKIDTDPVMRERYVTERVKFLTLRRFAQRVFGIDGYNTKIRQREISIGSIRRAAFPDDDYRQLYSMYESVIDELVIRPRRPELELTHHWDEVTIQDPTNFGLPSVFDISVHTSSIVDPRTILNGKGARGFAVDLKSVVTRNHDNDWGVSGSASYFPFVSGSFSTSNSEHFRSTISKVRQVEVNFEHLGELQVMRDRWFASTVLSDNKRVHEFLKTRPVLAEKLTLLTTGVMVGRGLSLTLTFTDSSDVQEWGSSSTSASAGVNVFGIQLGGSGGSSSSYNNHRVDTVKKTVTFNDGPEVCRLVGLRVTPLKTGANASAIARGARPIFEIPALEDAIQEDIRAGRVPDMRVIEERFAKRGGADSGRSNSDKG